MEKEHVYLSELNNYLRERTYLIVLDDVWSDEVFEWLKDGLPDGNKSKIIITTRSLDVANLATSSSVYKLPFLGEKESLELLLKNALQIPDTSGNCSDELRDVARKLASRYGGLPLAIVVLGCLLFKKPHAHWSQVEKNLDWYRDGERCMNILYSSYHDLPYYLKSCFRYLACFPEDHEIKVVPLLRMWIAEGFMDHNKKGMLEDEAEHCLKELAQRSLVQVLHRDHDDSIESLRVHDILHDLAIRESEENDFLLICNKENKQNDFKKARRGVVHNNHNVKSQNKNLENIAMPNVRSFLNFDREVPIGIIYPLLRVLELKGNKNLKKLPDELKSMIHVRYLGLSHTGLEQLTETIGCLQNLQTINIEYTKVKKIPSSLWGIQALRHVTLKEWLPGPPLSANLVNLQTLENITVPESWRDGLPHLPSLRTLRLCYFDKEENGNPMPKLENLPYLKSLYLAGIKNIEEMLCSAGGFPQLQELTIWNVADLKQWKVEKEAMPLLKTLTIDDCKNLPALPDLYHVKTLQELRLIEMSDALKSKLEDHTGDEWQKIQHVPTIHY
ncbi:hypothetical protein LUZ60_002292 [Juncus effusus]|nr:hypothetical protein LUZ60_002292 [Juncus effusus]